MRPLGNPKNAKNGKFINLIAAIFAAISSNREMQNSSRLIWHKLESLIVFSQQVYLVFAYCFLLILILSFIEEPDYFLILGLLLCLIYVIWSEIKKPEYYNLTKHAAGAKNSLTVKVEMRYIRNISAALKQQLSGLSDEDIKWMVDVGEEKRISSNQIIISEDQPFEELYLILEGKFEISTNSSKLFPESVYISTLDSGIIGETSLLRRRNQYRSSATVKASEKALVWSITKQDIENKIRLDPRFGIRFYEAIADIIADRLEAANELRASMQGRRSISNRKRQKFTKDSTLDSPKTLGILLYTIDNSPSIQIEKEG